MIFALIEYWQCCFVWTTCSPVSGLHVWELRPACCNRVWWDIIETKIFQFLQPAWSVTAVALVPLVSFSTFKFIARFKCGQMLTGAPVCVCEICADLSSCSPPPSPGGNVPRHIMFPSSWERQNLCTELFSAQRKKSSRKGERCEEGQSEWKEMIQILQTDKLLQQQQWTDWDKAFSFGWGWNSDKPKANFLLFFVSFVNFPPAFLISCVQSTFRCSCSCPTVSPQKTSLVISCPWTCKIIHFFRKKFRSRWEVDCVQLWLNISCCSSDWLQR